MQALQGLRGLVNCLGRQPPLPLADWRRRAGCVLVFDAERLFTAQTRLGKELGSLLVRFGEELVAASKSGTFHQVGYTVSEPNS